MAESASFDSYQNVRSRNDETPKNKDLILSTKYSILQTLLFIFYLLLFSFFITRISFFRESEINKWLLVGLFFLKIAAGIAYAKFYRLPQYYQGSDTWRFYSLSLAETKWLKHDPVAFVKDLFVYGYNKSGNLFAGENTYWNDLKSNVPVKLLAVFNLFTHNSYYIAVIFFNFLFLFGLVALFRLFNQLFPNKKLLIIAGIFLLPSTLFWCSGIHKDGLILSATGIIVYFFYSGLTNKFTLGKWVAIFLCLLLIFSLRNYVAFVLLPPLLCWWLCYKYNKGVGVFAGVYGIAIVLFFAAPLIVPSLNFPGFIAGKQHEFLLLQGSSQVKVQQLEPTFKSFISFLPSALDMAFLRPHFNEIKNFSYLPAAVEVLLLAGLIVLCVCWLLVRRPTTAAGRRPTTATTSAAGVVGEEDQQRRRNVAVLFFLFFSFSIMLLSGYTIPFSGAIVRYRSFVLPMMITSLLCLVEFEFGRKRRV